MTPRERFRRAMAILEEELDDRPVDLTRAADALEASEDLSRYPRSAWPAPANPWEELVVGLAVAVARVQGAYALTRSHAIEEIRQAIAQRAARARPSAQ